RAKPVLLVKTNGTLQWFRRIKCDTFALILAKLRLGGMQQRSRHSGPLPFRQYRHSSHVSLTVGDFVATNGADCFAFTNCHQHAHCGESLLYRLFCQHSVAECIVGVLTAIRLKCGCQTSQNCISVLWLSFADEKNSRL